MHFTKVEISEAGLADVAKLNDAIETFAAANPSTHLVPVEESRRMQREGGRMLPAPVSLDNGEDRTCPSRDGRPIPLRVFVPETVNGLYLHLHGGGWALGSASQGDVGLWGMATAADVAVVSVEYRLAPEDPFPAGPDDCEDAAMWLLANAKTEFGTERVVIGGESAGANLAAVTLLRLRDNHDALGALRGANLVYGAYDLAMTPSQRLWGERPFILSTPIMAWFYDLYLPGLTAEQRRDPRISPLYADLTGMPPALFTVGDLDPLLDDSYFLAARWSEAGAEADLRVYPSCSHAFDAFPTEPGRLARKAMGEFVRTAVLA